MRWLDRLERRFGRWAIPNLTKTIVLGQVLVYVLIQLRPEIQQQTMLVPALVLQGQVWRLVTLVFDPPTSNLFFAVLFWYFFYFMGTALESLWGAFRLNVYLAVGYLATAAVAFVTPALPTGNGFLYSSVFLAFATLFPDFQIYLFFVLPIRARWMAVVMWIGYAWAFLAGAWPAQLTVLASVSNYFLFYHREIWEQIKTGRRRMAAQTRSRPQERPAFHQCRICGITDQSHPDMDFRYCSRCEGACCYCPEHLQNHEHVRAADPDARR